MVVDAVYNSSNRLTKY